MDLKEFVRQSLLEIIEGVSSAQNEARDFGAVINPSTKSADTIDVVTPAGFWAGRNARKVEFDVAVTVANTADGKVGGNLRVWGIGFGGEAASSHSSEAVSRLRFSVEVALPVLGPK